MNDSEKQKRVTYIKEAIREADDASRDQRLLWDELWALYQNKQDYNNKKRWQAKTFIPKTYMTIEQAAAMVKRAILSIQRLFHFVPRYSDDIAAIEMQDDVEGEFRRQLQYSNFADMYGEMIKSAFVTGIGCPKVLWDGEKKRLYYCNAQATNIYVDPCYQPGDGNQPRYIIEEQEMDLAEFRRIAKEANRQAEKPIWDMSEIDKIKDGWRVQHDRTDTTNYNRGLNEFNPKTKKICLHQYWGDVVSEDGLSIEKSRLIVVANKQYLIRDQENPFDHKKQPYTLTYPIPYPHRGTGGVSLVGPVVTLQYAYNNIMNMMLDNMNFTVNKVFEVNTSAAMNPHALTDIYPGKLIHKTGVNPAVTPVETTQIGQDAFAMLKFLETEIQRGTGVTEFIMGLSGNAKTATEVQMKTAQAQGIFDVIARQLEQTSLKPLMELSLAVLVQYGVMPSNVLDRYDIEVGGVSLVLKQQEQIDRIQQVIGMAIQSPDIGKMTRVKSLYKKLLDLYNLSDIYVDSVDQNSQAMVTQEQASGINQRAEQDADDYVNRLSPDEIMQMAQV